jgi:hypothetical protein
VLGLGKFGGVVTISVTISRIRGEGDAVSTFLGGTKVPLCRERLP